MIYKKYKINLLTAFFLLASLLLSALFISPTAVRAAEAKCYVSDGSLIIEVPCGSAGGSTSGSRTYRDTNGNSISGPENDKCYLSTSTGTHQTYTEQTNCTELANQSATDEQRCEASGGRWENGGCQDCPGGTTSNGVTCVGTNMGGNPEGDCKAGADGKIDQSNCGIIYYTVLLTRTLSALVGIVIVVMMVVGGIQYAASRDDPSQVAGAKDHIQNTVMALIFYIFALAFLQWLVPGGVF